MAGRERRRACARTPPACARRSPPPRAAPAATRPTSSCSPRSSTSTVEDLGALAEAGITLLGENRAQQLAAKAAAWPPTLRWHFIGQLQSRKVSQILPLVELIHSVASDSALAQLERHAHARDRDPRRGQRRGGGGQGRHRARRRCRAFLARAPVRVVGLMAMPPFARGSRRRAARTSPRCASWPPSTGCATSRWAPRRTTRSPSRRARRSSASGRYSSTDAWPGKGIPCWQRRSHRDGLLRLLAPHPRLLRPRRGPRRVRGRGGAAGGDPRARGRAGGPLPRAPERPAAEHAPAPGRDRRHLRRRLAVRAPDRASCARSAAARPTAAAGRSACIW